MYQTEDIVRFALSEFERGLEGLTDAEARIRMKKADGTEMNAISWTVGHIAWHWLISEARAASKPPPDKIMPYRSGSDDPTPPPLKDALALLAVARASTGWITKATPDLMTTIPQGSRLNETVGTGLMRVILHTWFHTGEINAVRQLLGHPEIRYIGALNQHLEWRP